MRHGEVVRAVAPVDPPTTTATLGALLSGRLPARTGVTMACLPARRRRFAASVPGLEPRHLGFVLLRDRPLRSTLSLGLPASLLPLGAHRTSFHVHGEPREISLHPGRFEDPIAAGWILPPTLARHRACTVPLDVPGADGPSGYQLDLLLQPERDPWLRAVCRARDARAGRLHRCGRGWVARTRISCLDSPRYRETCQALVAPAGPLTLWQSEHTHLTDVPPDLAKQLEPRFPVWRPDGRARWRDAERLQVLERALALEHHERLVCRLDGPGPGVSDDDLDRRLGRLATLVLQRGGTLIVVGLGGRVPATGTLDLPRALRTRLAALVQPTAPLVVRVEEGFARIELARPSGARRRQVEQATSELAGPGAVLRWVTPGSLQLLAPPGLSLDGRPRLTVAGGAGRRLDRAGALFCCGAGVPRRAHCSATILEVHRLVRRCWQPAARTRASVWRADVAPSRARTAPGSP
jgi:hypothetical protein